MSASNRPSFLPRLPASTIAALISVAIIGCAARTSPPPTGEQASNAVAGSSECSGKEEEEKECPEFLGDCVAGDVPSYDADGCRIGCKSPCAGKACGVDCTPEGSDEPFNCSAAGQCVAAGATLGCVEVCSNPEGCKPPSPCDGKACGVDCTPEGSDEPFNCNANGVCVATGQPLGCQ